MIDPQILRINNLVRCDALIPNTIIDRTPYLPPGIFRVDYINRHFIGLDLGFGATQKVKPEDIKGVDITEDWLRWCGFNKNESPQYYWIFQKIALIPDGELYYFADWHTQNPLIVKFIHNIQNIHIDLNEEQLAYEIPEELREN